MTTLAINLKNMLEMEEISTHELSRRTGVKQPVISRILSGENQNPKLQTLKALATYFSVTTSQLIGELNSEALWEGNQPNINLLTEIPVLNWDLKQNSNPVLIQVGADISNKSFALTINSPSMEPRFTIGTKIVIDPTKMALNHDYVVVLLENENTAQLKQLLIDNGKKYLLSSNLKFEDFRELKPQDKIIGKVIRSILDFQNFQ